MSEGYQGEKSALMRLVCNRSIHDTVQSAENSGICVSGEEKIQATPDIAEITYSVYTQEKDAKSCQTQNATEVDAVISLLKEKGIDEKEMKTSNVGLNPIYDWNNGRICIEDIRLILGKHNETKRRD